MSTSLFYNICLIGTFLPVIFIRNFIRIDLYFLYPIIQYFCLISFKFLLGIYLFACGIFLKSNIPFLVSDFKKSIFQVLNSFRVIMIIQVVIAITAVDFPSFPSYCGKIKNGYSYMNIGTGSFLLVNGFFCKENKIMRKIIIYFFIGIFKAVFMRIFSYNLQENEYGIFLNFPSILSIIYFLFKFIREESILYLYLIVFDRKYIVSSYLYLLICAKKYYTRMKSVEQLQYDLLEITNKFIFHLSYEQPSYYTFNLSHIYFILFSHFLLIYIYVHLIESIGTLYIFEYLSGKIGWIFILGNCLTFIYNYFFELCKFNFCIEVIFMQIYFLVVLS